MGMSKRSENPRARCAARPPFGMSLLARCGAVAMAGLALPSTGLAQPPADPANRGRQVLLAQGESPSPAAANFNGSFLIGQARAIDLSAFTHGNPVLAGRYLADVYVNGQWQGRRDLAFRNSGGRDASTCMTPAMLEEMNIDSAATAAGAQAGAADACKPIEQWIPDAYARFDSATLRLDVSVPQAYLRRTARGYVSPALWDRGVDAGFVGYNFNWYGNRMDQAGGSRGSSSGYLGLNSGVNVNGWQFRHDSSFSWQSGEGRHWQNVATYAQRGLADIRSLLTIGDAYTSGELFDSIGFRGVRLASDDRMLPDSLRGYAPVVRGIASTNARVEVRQNGQLIYSTSVAPGAFTIDDLYPTGYGGDLQVTVTEADGQQQRFSVPYASVAQMLRPGLSRYSVTAGKLRNQSLQYEPYLLQGTYQRGINNWFTAYGAANASEKYAAGLIGGGVSTPIGAFALDATLARARLPRSGDSSGTSVRVSYSKLLPQTRTNFTLAAYRYSTSGFYSLQDAVSAIAYERRGLGSEAVDRQRSQLQLTINQALGQRWGSFYFTGSTRQYWARSGRSVQFQAGYNNFYKSVNYGVSVIRTQEPSTRSSTQVLLSLSVPLGGANPVTVSSELSTRNGRYDSSRLAMTGSAGPDHNVDYGVAVSDGRDSAAALNANAQYQGRHAALSGGYSHSSDYQQVSVGASGSVVVHDGGVTLAPQRGDTMVIVQAPAATDARVSNASGLRVDGRGYAVVPYVSPYRMNVVTLDPEGMSHDVELESSSQMIAPYAGAIAKLTFATRRGRALLIGARTAAGEPLPFGAQVLDAEGQAIGMVAQASRIYVRTEHEQGQLLVKWGEAEGQQCRVDYQAPAQETAAGGAASGAGGFAYTEATCR